MNIEKIKEFIALRSELRTSGVIGLNLWEDEVQVNERELIGAADLQIKFRRFDTEYPHSVFVVRDGIKIFAILSTEQLEADFPQLAGYMVEDVLLDGMKEGEEIA